MLLFFCVPPASGTHLLRREKSLLDRKLSPHR
jgi:hypothetical protein